MMSVIVKKSGLKADVEFPAEFDPSGLLGPRRRPLNKDADAPNLLQHEPAQRDRSNCEVDYKPTNVD